MKKYIGLVCGAVLLAALAAGCSGAFGFDGKGGIEPDKDNPFAGTTWVDSTNGLTLSFDANTCEITTGTSKSANTAIAARAVQINGGTYSYTWEENDDGSFTATLKYSSGGVYAYFTIDASGAVSGTLIVDGKEYPFGKKTGTGGGSGEDESGGGTATETPGTFTINDDGKLVKYTIGNETDITIPDTVKYIGNRAFYGCRTLTNVKIPASVESIGLSAFSGCSRLKVYYDGTQEDWNHILFYTTMVDDTTTDTGLEGKTITGNDGTSWKFDNFDSLVWRCRVGMEIYNYTKSEEIVRIPLGTQSIARVNNDIRIFEGKTTIKQVIIPNTVKEILSEAFSGCTGLESISISNSMTSIVNKMFYGCTSLASITIPDSVTKIESQAFMNCKSLASVSLPEGLTSIGLMAFRNCTSLTSITIPNSVTEIDREVFWGCESLERVSIPVGMTIINQSAFRDCKKLTSVTIPDSVTSIWPYAFQGCEELKTVNYDGTQEQWNDISKWNDYGLKGKTIICSDGELTAE